MADAAPETSPAVEAARAALAEGELWRARDVLAERVERTEDPEALVLLGEVLHRMGDLPAAGAAWFGAGVKGPQVAEATEAWRERHDDDFASMWASLPGSVRHGSHSPKVAALARRAGVTDEAPTAGPPGGGAASAGAGAPTGTAGAQPGAAGGQPGAAGGQPGAVGAPKAAGGASTGPARAGAPANRPVPRSASRPVRSSDGVDAAQVIAWLLAALVVVCSVVGLVTILRWMVPG
jgi:hypothetical protein